MTNLYHDTHFYTASGKLITGLSPHDGLAQGLYPSDTTVLQVIRHPALEHWKGRELIKATCAISPIEDEEDKTYFRKIEKAAAKSAQQAAERGSRVHEALTKMLQGQYAEGLAIELNAAKLLREWVQEHISPSPLVEQFVYNEAHGYAGTYDLMGSLIDGQITIIDFKTQQIKGDNGPRYWDSWLMQLAAYAACYNPPPAIMSVVVDATNPSEVYSKPWTAEEQKAGWRAFIACLEVWRFLAEFET